MVLPPPAYEGTQSGLLNPHKWIHGPYRWVMVDHGKRPEHEALGCDSMQGFLLGYPSVQRSLSRRSPTTISLSWAEASSESGHQQAPDCPHQSNEQTRLVLENDCRPAFTDGPGDLVPFAPRLAPPRMKSASDSRS